MLILIVIDVVISWCFAKDCMEWLILFVVLLIPLTMLALVLLSISYREHIIDFYKNYLVLEKIILIMWSRTDI